MILDASGLIGLVAGQPAARRVAALLREDHVAVTSINLAEARDKLERIAGLPAQQVDQAIDDLLAADVEVAAIDSASGRFAGRLRAQLYHRRTNPLSIADCVALAVAINHRAQLATSDRALARAALAQAVEVVPLPNSAGQLP